MLNGQVKRTAGYVKKIVGLEQYKKEVTSAEYVQLKRDLTITINSIEQELIQQQKEIIKTQAGIKELKQENKDLYHNKQLTNTEKIKQILEEKSKLQDNATKGNIIGLDNFQDGQVSNINQEIDKKYDDLFIQREKMYYEYVDPIINQLKKEDLNTINELTLDLAAKEKEVMGVKNNEPRGLFTTKTKIENWKNDYSSKFNEQIEIERKIKKLEFKLDKDSEYKSEAFREFRKVHPIEYRRYDEVNKDISKIEQERYNQTLERERKERAERIQKRLEEKQKRLEEKGIKLNNTKNKSRGRGR